MTTQQVSSTVYYSNILSAVIHHLECKWTAYWGVLEPKQVEFNITSQLFDYNSIKNNFVETNSTLPPWWRYMLDIQRVERGGIRGGIMVELREIPPIIPP